MKVEYLTQKTKASKNLTISYQYMEHSAKTVDKPKYKGR